MDVQQIIVEYLFAQKQEDKLKELGANVPSDFKTKQSLYSAVLNNPLYSSLLQQNEFNRLITEKSEATAKTIKELKEQIEANEEEIRSFSHRLTGYLDDLPIGLINTNQIRELIPNRFRPELPISLPADDLEITFISDLGAVIPNTTTNQAKIVDALIHGGVFTISQLRDATEEAIAAILLKAGISGVSKSNIKDWKNSASEKVPISKK